MGRVIFRISNLGLGLSILGLGDGILDRGLCTLGLWQGLDLLAFALVLKLRTILASSLALGHLSLLALVISLVKPFGDFRKRKKGMGGGGLLREG